MAWREEIARYADNGDRDGVLRIFDELWNDRQRVRALNDAYLQHMGGKPVASDPLEACGEACRSLAGALKRLGASS